MTEGSPAPEEPIQAAATKLPIYTSLRYRRAVNRLTRETPARLDNFVPDQVDADAVRAWVVNAISSIEPIAVDEVSGHALDNAINAMMDQRVGSISAQHAVYQASVNHLNAVAAAIIVANQRALLLYKRRLDEAREILASSEGRWARRRATKSYRKASLLYELAQVRLRDAEAAGNYYAGALQASDRVRDEAISSTYALGVELKQRARLEIAKRLADVSAADVFIAPPESERLRPGSDHPVEE
jgi:hypothetical protein